MHRADFAVDPQLSVLIQALGARGGCARAGVRLQSLLVLLQLFRCLNLPIAGLRLPLFAAAVLAASCRRLFWACLLFLRCFHQQWQQAQRWQQLGAVLLALVPIPLVLVLLALGLQAVAQKCCLLLCFRCLGLGLAAGWLWVHWRALKSSYAVLLHRCLYRCFALAHGFALAQLLRSRRCLVLRCRVQ